ncbi:MAG: VCBS repeat-containing protein [Proteobacteria bacterium]|nr:VCBS repeat-containing protein [Pseudomonadota bacterium]
MAAFRTFLDADGDGLVDVFAARQTYDPNTSTASTATPATFTFWRQLPNGQYEIDTNRIASGTGCIHPRKPIVADFNGDGKPDVFVACHGYDAAPFPGEKNKVVLSRPDGKYDIKDAGPDVGFFHGATAADMNGDGKIDVVVVNNFDPRSAYALLNDGTGQFTSETTNRFPAAIRNRLYFSVEVVDIDEDGKPDVWLGGHEWEFNSESVVLLNPGNHDYSAVTPVSLPAVPNEGVVLDVSLTGTGADRNLWLVRTSGGDGTFYQSRVVQKINWATKASSVVLNQRPAQWVPWIFPATVNGQKLMVADDAALGLSIPQ